MVGQNILTISSVIVLLSGLIIFWAIVSIPIWIAAKVVTVGKATFGEAMSATLAGPIVYFVVFLAVEFFLGTIIGSGALV
jgi:hypothetical protein